MTAHSLEIVASVAANGVIGRDGQLPWRLPDDLRHFKTLTMGHPVIMGRRTYDSIGRPLPGRTSIVISRTLAEPPATGILLAQTPEEAVRIADTSPGPAFVIGGAAIYAALMPLCSVMHLTELDVAVEGDAVFPRFTKLEWSVASQVLHERDARHAISFRFRVYERVGATKAT